MDEAAPGIYRWTAPHPEWLRSEEVEVVRAGGRRGPAAGRPAAAVRRRRELHLPLLAALELLVAAAARVEVLRRPSPTTRAARRCSTSATRRSAPPASGRDLVRTRLRPETPLEVVPIGAAGTATPIAGDAAEAYTIGRPRRSEHPRDVPPLRAVVFGDAVVGTQGGLRFWYLSSTDADWYREVFAPTLAPLAERPLEHVLVTHGPPVIGDGGGRWRCVSRTTPVRMY